MRSGFAAAPQSPQRPGITLQKTIKPETSLYLRGNIGPGRSQDVGDEWAAVLSRTSLEVRSDRRTLAGDRVSIEPVSGLREHVLASAGATVPVRDGVDARIVQSVRDGAGGLINSQRDVGGWPAYRSATAPTDSDRDGIPDDWEKRHGLNPGDPTDGSQTAADGYTWIEKYLNEQAR